MAVKRLIYGKVKRWLWFTALRVAILIFGYGEQERIVVALYLYVM